MATRTRTSEAPRGEREMTLKAAAELTGCSGKLLRRHIREGRLRPASMDGDRMTVTTAALREAGLLPALPLDSGPPAPRPDEDDGEAEAEAEAAAAREQALASEAAAAKSASEKAAAEKAAAEKAAAEKSAAEKAAAEKAARDKAAGEAAAREKAEREKAERDRAERARVEKERADKERSEKAERERAERERGERERAAKERAERERAEKQRADKVRAEREAAEKADRAARERAEKERSEKERADKERETRERAERDRADAERERADKARAESERAEKARAEKARAERDRGKERAERERREREAEASKVVPMSRSRPQLEDLDDLEEAEESDELDDREIEELEGELDDLPADDDETVRLQAESSRPGESRVHVVAEPVPAERGMVVSGGGPWVTSNQLADLMRLLAAEREARSQEWMERTESLYREMVESQKQRIASLEEEGRGLQSRLEEALRMVPKGENVAALEQMIRDLRIEVDRKEAARADLEHERDRLRDLTDRLRNDLSRAEKRNLEMAEQLRRFRAQGIFDRLVGREPDER